MNWENADFLSEEEGEEKFSSLDNKRLTFENNERVLFQLSKFQDPHQNITRQAYINIITKFNHLLVQNKTQEISQALLDTDCQMFLFEPKMFFLHCSKGEDLQNLYKGLQIKDRFVIDSLIDVEKSQVCQICTCQVMYEETGVILTQGSFETFSIGNGKITKYRAIYGSISPYKAIDNPLLPTRSDIMLARVKEFNYALAGKPNPKKIASALQDQIEYRLWDWDSQKCHTLEKQNFVSTFEALQENYTVNLIVPFEIYRERDFIVGNYIYYLEGKNAIAGQKFLWMSTALYYFDKDVNIIKIRQQGELYLEEEAEIPFSILSREDLEEKTKRLFSNMIDRTGALYTEDINPAGTVFRVGPEGIGGVGLFDGFDELLQFTLTIPEDCLEFLIPVDIYVDFNDPCYNVAIAASLSQGTPLLDCNPDRKKKVNDFSLNKLCFENGKIAKIVQFFTLILEPIPSPYDDKTIHTEYIKV